MYGNKNEVYTFDENDSFEEVLDHLSIKFNYNYFRHKKSVNVHTEQDNYKGNFLIKNLDMNLGDLPCKKNMVLYISMSPNSVAEHFKDGYSRPTKEQT